MQTGNLVDIHTAGTGIDDVLVESALLIDIGWMTGLHKATALEDENLVGIDNLADVVRDDDDGASALDSIDAGLDLFGGNGIETGGRFVEEDDGGILDEHAGDGNALLLTAAELESCGLEAVGQLHNLFVDICLTGCLDDIVVRSLGISVLDILFDSADEDVILL